MDLPITFMDRYKTLQKLPTLLRTITDLLIAFTDHYKTSSTRYALYYTI